MHPLETYLHEIALIHASGGGVNELSYYPPLAALLSEVGKGLKPKVRCVSSLKNVGAGMPDFGLFTADQFLRSSDAEPLEGQKPARGVVEAKGPGVELAALVKTKQVQDYVGEYGLALLTNLREFAVAGPGPGRAVILEACQLAKSEAAFWQAATHAPKTAGAHGERLVEFLKRSLTRMAPIYEPKDLAWLLASYAREARLRVEQAGDLPALAGLRKGLEETLGIEFSGAKGEHFFRSTLVQTLFYGVFSAWVLWHEQKPARQPEFDWRLSTYYLHVPILMALFHQLSNPLQLKPLGLYEVLDWAGDALNRVDQAAFFSRFERAQAVQYFYEPFLEAYDPELRKELGVWYTPPEIVRYMVARVDAVLRSELGLPDGLASEGVYVLDPCCGTGAYPLEVLRRIAQTLAEKGEEALLAHDLKTIAQRRVFGFEILPAPFVIAHLQIGLFLQEYGVEMEEGERAGVFLTNALTGWDPAKAQPPLPMPELANERDAAHQVKQHTPVLVVLGNPPYNAYAGVAPRGEEADMVKPYKEGLIKTWGIKKFNLDDLYVRFFRLSERAIAEKAGRGVVCFISNYSWLSGPSFVVLRQHLLENFDRFWIENLHGDRKISEYAPDGHTSETIFAISGFSPGIQQGVAISLWAKSGQSGLSQVLYRDDLNQAKAETRRADLLASLDDPDFEKHYELASPTAENRFSFRPASLETGYLSWPKVVELCKEYPCNGPVERRGNSLIRFEKEKDRFRVLEEYLNPNISDEEITAIEPRFMHSSGEFIARDTRAKLKGKVTFEPKKIVRYPFKPFDNRLAYLDNAIHPLFSRPSPELLENREIAGNKFFITRDTADKDPEGPPFFYSRLICDYDCISGHARHFPLLVQATAKSKRSNQLSLLSSFIKPEVNLSSLSCHYLQHLGVNPDVDYELLWLHALAIGYSPAYLSENADGIRQDWPRIPLPAGKESLLASAALGRQVANLLDTETPVPGVTTGALRLELKPLGMLGRVGGGALHPEHGDLALTAGWGHAGKEGVTMPGHGRLAARELAGLGGLSGPGYDVYLNETALWQNIPAAVWEFTIGGYQVIKKWLSYRERDLLGRDLTVEEARYVTEMARRLGALVLLQEELDGNYEEVKREGYGWGNKQE